MKGTFCWLGLFACAAVAFAQEVVQTRVNLTSEPSGATIFVDGRPCGTTPRMFFDLTPGSHLVKYALSGYVEKDFLLVLLALLLQL